MGGPWEQYQQAPSDGPWTQYATPTAPAPPEPMTARESFESSLPVRFLRGVEGPAIVALKAFGPDSMKKDLTEIDALRESGMKKRGTAGMNWAGLFGSLIPGAAIGGGVANALPAAASLAGKVGTGAVVGGVTAAGQPIAGGDELSVDKLKQIGTGAAVGGAIPVVGSAISKLVGTPNPNAVLSKTLTEGQQAGYVVPPSMVNPSPLNNRLESIAGKASVAQEAAKRNQGVTNALAAQSLGLPPNTALTPEVLKGVRNAAEGPYREVESLKPSLNMDWFPRFHETDLLGKMKQARADATQAFKSNQVNPHPDTLQRAQDLKALADSLESDIGRIAEASGKPELVKALVQARQKMAKSFDVENALNLADANVSAPILARMLDKGKPLTGELGTTARFAEAFPQVMREGSRVPASGVSGTDAAASAVLGTLGYGAGGPAGMLAAGLPLLRGPARALALSPTYQKFSMSPDIAALIESLAQRSIPTAGTIAGRQAGGQ